MSKVPYLKVRGKRLLIWRPVGRFATLNIFEKVPLAPQESLICKFPPVRIHLSKALPKAITTISEIDWTIQIKQGKSNFSNRNLTIQIF
jgi:muconolactone delta-isomerase